MSKDISSRHLVEGLPYALSEDDNKRFLAECIAAELELLFREKECISIYPNIDNLEESMLDRIAIDCKVDWYLFDGTLKSKRAQIKSCFKLHRCLGTKYALLTALSDVFPGSAVEEWFEYGGRPYHFTLVLDITETGSGIPITQAILERIVNAVKPVRAVLESDTITYRVRNAISVSVSSGYALYSVRLCGTHPSPAIIGRIDDSTVIAYATPSSVAASEKTNSPTGVYPDAAYEGSVKDSYINFATESGTAAYSTRLCGMPLGTL